MLKIYLVSQNILLIFSYHVDRVDDVKALRVDGDQDVGVAVDEQRRQGPRWSLNLKMTKTIIQMIRFSSISYPEVESLPIWVSLTGLRFVLAQLQRFDVISFILVAYLDITNL